MVAEPVVILGAGHAGVGAAAALRDEGFDGPVRLVNGEQNLPYQRPPLSKAFMKGEVDAGGLVLRGEGFYAQRGIELLHGKAVRIDRHQKALRFQTGATLSYGHLILATGSRQRRLPFATDGAKINYLGSLPDAETLRDRLTKAKKVVIIGAGFIGLEFAAVALQMECEPHVVEQSDRLLARSVSPLISSFFEAEHRRMGVNIRLSRTVVGIRSCGSEFELRLSDGLAMQADLVVAGIGTTAEDSLAIEAGLPCDNGIIVDSDLLTADDSISAVGDCTRHPNKFVPGGLARLECVQNALDQAKAVARRLTGKKAAYDAVPWFWSDQSDLKLQIAGIWSNCDRFAVRGDLSDRAFSVLGYDRDGRLKVVESVNKPAEHMAARKLIAAEASIPIDQATDKSIPLKTFVASP
ncbi:FAD-dependent oxidoreductase [Bradyrhizobium sp. NP1]|uniref:NAD(P)/FAD-dependent oxidoreductase n=1 Tax=Bradyrhizobium sp. NP1 TaxID=3049772 RepID=UPI0025A520B7|nr:FAD-dependent oxidoreductase [Bradyrhizobium sp. NP1]WJR75824.1 FAD-dependent oxidoreductase [Bradyrhizobium sp. NP1]